MAEKEAAAGGAFSGGESGGGARTMMGGSLPPRKRLLAGLKQNGLWLAASTQAAPTIAVTIHGSEGGAGEDAGVLEVSPDLTTVPAEVKGNCMNCGALESNSWRRVKRNGAMETVCNSCAILLNKNMSCLYCKVACSDAKDSPVWLQCYRCQRVVHVECEKRISLSSNVDDVSFLCSECVQVKLKNELTNSLLETRAQGYVGRVGVICCLESGKSASSAATECLSPRSKKARVLNEPRSKPSWTVAGDPGEVDRMCHDVKTGFERKGVTSQEAAVAAAEAVAALACRAAAAARVTAAAKAAAAVKAAALAKAALDAAALAARADAQARTDLRRSSLFSEYTSVGGGYEAALADTRKERVEKLDTRAKGVDIRGAIPSSLDDEELARELHRVMNSSPRISRGLAPIRRKPLGQTATVSSVSDSVRVIPRSGLAGVAEPRPHSKQQQTKPRSLCQKDGKRLESRVVKHEPKTADSDSCQNSLQQAMCTTASDDAGQIAALQSELTDSSTLRQNSGAVRRQETSTCSEELVKTQIDHVDGATLQVLDDIDGYHGGMFSGAVVSQAAAMLDEVLMSEVDAEEAEEGYLCNSPVGMSQHVKEVPDPPTASILTVSKADAQEFEEQLSPRIVERGGVVDLCPGVATLAEVASSAMENLEFSDASPREPFVEERALHGDGVGLEAGHDQGTFCSRIGKSPLPLSDEFSVKNAKSSSEFEDSPSESLLQPGVHGKTWQRGVLKGMPGGGQGFAGGVRVSPFSSTPPMPICTPALVSRSTTRHL